MRRGGGGDRPGGAADDGRRGRRRRVDRPGALGDRARPPALSFGVRADRERVRPVGQARVALRGRACAEVGAVEPALEGRRGIGRAELEGRGRAGDERRRPAEDRRGRLVPERSRDREQRHGDRDARRRRDAARWPSPAAARLEPHFPIPSLAVWPGFGGVVYGANASAVEPARMAQHRQLHHVPAEEERGRPVRDHAQLPRTSGSWYRWYVRVTHQPGKPRIRRPRTSAIPL